MDEASFIEKSSRSAHPPWADTDAAPPVRTGKTAWLYAWVAGCLLLAVAIVGWLGFELAQGRLKWEHLVFFVAAALAFVMGLTAWRQLDDTTGIVLSRDDAPVLFEALERLQRQLNGPRIGRVALDAQFAIHIRREPRFGRLGGTMNRLTLGLPLLLALDRRRLLALLAHEYASFHGGRGRMGQWLDQRLPRWRHRWGPTQNVEKLRRKELEADRVSRKLLGRHVAAAALIEFTVKADWIRREFWPGHWRAASTSLTPMPPFAAMRVLASTPPPEGFARESLRRALARPSDPRNSFSLLRDRLDALRSSGQLPAWSSTQAIRMFGKKGNEWLAEFDRQWCRDNAAEWKQHRAYLSRVRQRGQEMAARFRDSTADELIEIAGLMRRLDANANVRELYERALQLERGHPDALRGLIRCLPEAERELRLACAAELYEISENSHCWVSRAAVSALEKKHFETADEDPRLPRWRARRDEAEQQERWAAQLLAETPVFDSIEPGDLNEFEKGEMMSRLARCPPVQRAWLVRKRLGEFAARRSYLVFLELRRLNPDTRYHLCRELESSLELPGLTRVVPAGLSPTLSEVSRRAFEPVYVRSHD